jgi:hypothetical protein
MFLLPIGRLLLEITLERSVIRIDRFSKGNGHSSSKECIWRDFYSIAPVSRFQIVKCGYNKRQEA